MNSDESIQRTAELVSLVLRPSPLVRAIRAIRAVHTARHSSHQHAGAVVLTGPVATGKTTLARAYEMALPKLESASGRAIPVLRLDVPVAASVKGVLDAFASALGDLQSSPEGIEQRLLRVLSLLRERRVELVIVDEAGRLTDPPCRRTHRAFAGVLRALMSGSSLPFVFIGTPGVRRLFRLDLQLARQVVRWIALPDPARTKGDMT